MSENKNLDICVVDWGVSVVVVVNYVGKYCFIYMGFFFFFFFIKVLKL